MAENHLTQEEIDLIRQLRADASDLKECFTRFSFQSLAIAAAGLSLIARYQKDFPAVALGATLIAVLLVAVSRIGTYKYASANRMYGYELHLYRTYRLRTPSSRRWTPAMRSIGWEEAMRAWRIVQATVFETLYTVKTPNRLRPEHRAEEYRWWEPDSLLEKGAAWHSGTYLETMLSILHWVAACCMIPLMILCLQIHDSIGFSFQLIGSVGLTVITGRLIIARVRECNARRVLLERGLLSIHSCAIMWQAVVVAHNRALADTGGDPDGMLQNYKGYTRNLSALAIGLAENVAGIHEWIDTAEQGPAA